MLTDIGVIVGIYAFLRLGWHIRDRVPNSWDPVYLVLTVLGMILVALLTADIILIGNDWARELAD